MIIRRHAWVFGRVQGVGFRYSTEAEARRIGGLQGWVCNLPDGSVEVVVQGETDQVSALMAFLAQGPPSARIDRVEIVEETPQADLQNFLQKR